MLQTLILAKDTSTRVTIVLSNGNVQDLVTVLDTNTEQVTVNNNGVISTIPLVDIDVVFIYKNTALATTVLGWAITPAASPVDPTIGLAINGNFALTVNFKQHRQIFNVIGEADSTQSDLGFIADNLRDFNVLAIFINRNIQSYQYDVVNEGFGTVGTGSKPSGKGTATAESTYYVRKDGDDANAGTENSSEGAFATTDRALEFLRSVRGNNQEVDIFLGDSTALNPHELNFLQNGSAEYQQIAIKSLNDKSTCFLRGTLGTVVFDRFPNLLIDDITIVDTTNSIGVTNGVVLLQNCTIQDNTSWLAASRGTINFANTVFTGTYSPGAKVFKAENRSNIGISAGNDLSGLSINLAGTLLSATDYSIINYALNTTGLTAATLEVSEHSTIDITNMLQDANAQPDVIGTLSIVKYSSGTVVG